MILKCSVEICENRENCKRNKCQTNTNQSIKQKKINLLQPKSISFRIVNPNNSKYNQNIQLNNDRRSLDQISSIPDSIELKVKTKPMPWIIKTVIVIAIAIVFGLIVSTVSIFFYRWCMHDQIMMHHLAIQQLQHNSDSICHHSSSCKYEINTRALEESFFQNPVEPLSSNTNSRSTDARW